jgi:hypothetical protein
VNWVDLAAPPGAGKSTIAYPLFADKSVGWDGKLPPAYWRMFLDEITTLCGLVRDHPSFEAVLRMNDRSAKKMATVERMADDRTFVQTGLVQRILGFGWRLQEMGRDINLIRTALWRMPVSVGVAFLEADLETILARNREREKNRATRHENRSHQVAFMIPSIALAKEVLRERGVPVIEIDVQHQSIQAARAKLLEFSDQGACLPAQMGFGGQGPAIQSPPPWWRS